MNTSQKHFQTVLVGDVEILETWRDPFFLLNELEHDYDLKIKEYYILLQIRTLSSRERQSIFKYYFAGMTQSEICKQLGTNQQAIAIYLKRGREKIAKYFNIDLSDTKHLRQQFLAIRNK